MLMISIKSPSDIKKIRHCGKISSEIMNNALKLVVPGISTLEINKKIEEMMSKAGVTPWFKEVNNYKYASCISVNEDWVHGLPSGRQLVDGDVVSVDIGVKSEKYYVDHCWTVVASKSHSADPTLDILHKNPRVTEFLKTGVEALNMGISAFVDNSRVGNISNAMQKVVESRGYSLIREYTGHGVGFEPHESPLIPCYGTSGAGELLKVGMVFAIEVMYAIGEPKIVVASDGWTISTKDKQLSGMFEHTVALTENGPEILTI